MGKGDGLAEQRESEEYEREPEFHFVAPAMADGGNGSIFTVYFSSSRW
jgi:hypothetical protein